MNIGRKSLTPSGFLTGLSAREREMSMGLLVNAIGHMSSMAPLLIK